MSHTAPAVILQISERVHRNVLIESSIEILLDLDPLARARQRRDDIDHPVIEDAVLTNVANFH